MKKRALFLSLSALAMSLAIFACSLPMTGASNPEVVVITATLPPGGILVFPTTPSQIQPTQETQPTLALPPSNTPAPTNEPPTALPPTITSVPPSLTPVPPSLTPTATNTVPPCNQLTFVEDVTIPDGTLFDANKPFTKIWRFKNTGSCTWTSGYQLVFVNGDQMSGPASQSITSGTVPPNSTIDISVNLVSPAAAGTYHGSWKLKDPSGNIFGLKTSGGPFWVEIKVKDPGPPTVAALPDLYVSEFTISPSTPIKGQNAHARVGVYNQGNAVAGQFSVLWYGLSTFSNPSCTWTIENLTYNGGLILECDFVFQSNYPIDKISLVVVDPKNQVAEGNEGNNQGMITPFGVNNP